MVHTSSLRFVVFLMATVNCEYGSNVIDMDDILSEDFMPGTLLVLENPTSRTKTFNESLANVQAIEKVPDGSFGNAIETMTFHRSMMNQYLCRNFVAEQIIKDMTTSRIKRRMGHITPGTDVNAPSKFKLATKNNLLNDEGSTGYKNWLSKSATLEDIYRHYDQAQNKIDADIVEEEEKGEDFDEDYSTQVAGYDTGQSPAKHRGHTGLGTYYAGGGGYPYPNAVYHQSGGSDYHNGGGYQHGGGSSGHQGGGYHHGGDSGYQHNGDYSHHGGEHSGHYSTEGHHHHPVEEVIYHSSPPKYHGQHEESYDSKDQDLSKLFDIALTALAFLSFGMFIVHVIMCISATTSSTTTTAASMRMPMNMSPTATATGGTSTGNGGGSMTSTGGDGTNPASGGGTTSTGTEGATGTGAGGGMTATGGGNTGAGGGGTENTGPDTDTGGGDIDTGGGGTGNTGMGSGDAGTGGGNTDTDSGATGGAAPGTGSGGGSTGDGMTGTGGGTTGTGAAGTGTGSGRDTLKFRFRRDIPTISNPDNEALNELARRVLTSIEAALIANNDEGVCLRKSLCENNKYSRTLESRSKIIIPMWSLGMSWLAGRLIKNTAASTSMLDTLKASILGLGKADCEIIYQDCDLKTEMKRRRRRRRKRSFMS